MKNQKRIAFIILLIARIWGSLILLFLLFFVGAHVKEGLFSHHWEFNSIGEMLTFFFAFPVGTMIGLALTWKWEGLGGLIIVSGMIFLFIMKVNSPYFVAIAAIGFLFLVYWALSRGRQSQTVENQKEHHKIRRNNIVLAILISFVMVVVLQSFMYRNGNNSFITTEKDSSYNKNVGKVDVIVKVEEQLIPVFAHSFKHSLVSALESNDISANVSASFSEANSLSDKSNESREFISEATLHIHIKPLYRTRDDGYEAIVGTDYEASLIDLATENRVWQATGKVDYIAMFSSNYEAGEDIRKEFAWSTTASIVNAFIAEVNDQEPAPIYIVTEARQRHGQRVD